MHVHNDLFCQQDVDLDNNQEVWIMLTVDFTFINKVLMGHLQTEFCLGDDVTVINSCSAEVTGVLGILKSRSESVPSLEWKRQLGCCAGRRAVREGGGWFVGGARRPLFLPTKSQA